MNCAAKVLRGDVAISHDAGSAILYAFKARSGITIGSGETRRAAAAARSGHRPGHAEAVFHTLGIHTTNNLRDIPENKLIARYGTEFRKVIDLINEHGKYVLTPNLRENKVTWVSALDFSVTDSERLIFIMGRGLSRLFEQTSQFGFSTEHVDIIFGLDNRTTKQYELKVSFPTMDQTFCGSRS